MGRRGIPKKYINAENNAKLLRIIRRVNYPAHRAGHLKTALTALEISLVHDGT